MSNSTWAFLLEETQPERTGPIVRRRARWDLLSAPASFLIGLLLDPIEFMLEQKMMCGINKRAEAAALADEKKS